jgi:hypothetical protein
VQQLAVRLGDNQKPANTGIMAEEIENQTTEGYRSK